MSFNILLCLNLRETKGPRWESSPLGAQSLAPSLAQQPHRGVCSWVPLRRAFEEGVKNDKILQELEVHVIDY